MLIDDITISVQAGHGGRGAVAFNKNLMSLGPAGGSGGNGGSIYFEGTSDMSGLNHFRNKKEWHAEDGRDGRPQFSDGTTGNDLILKVPVGTVLHNLDDDTDQEIIKIGERILMAQGGHGGKGNFHFKSPRNTSPTQFQDGLPGEGLAIRMELKLIADVGLVGFPNAGKSNLINMLTRAQSKVANYPFTTLDPHLGTYYELIIADIPGLITGASQGKGLGTKFLRHIERTNVIFHLVAANSEDVVKEYQAIRAELGAYNPALLKKEEYVFLSKRDLVPEEEWRAKLALLKKFNSDAIAISVLDDDTMAEVKKILNKIKDEKFAEIAREHAVQAVREER